MPAGGFAREVAALALSCGFKRSYFYDHFKAENGIQKPSALQANAQVALAIGSSKERLKIYRELKNTHRLSYPKLIHPSAQIISPHKVFIGQGTIICAGSILTNDISLGKFVLINLHASIGHDCALGNFVSIMPGARLSGGVTLEDDVYVGTNASILPGLRIGRGATIGAGAVVTKDVEPNTTVVGVPARKASLHSRTL